MKTTISVGRLLVVCGMVAVGMFMPPSSIHGENKDVPEHHPAKEIYTGSVISIGGQFGGASRAFTLEVAGYTPDEEVQQDFQILRTQGQDDFMKAIKNKKLGYLAFEGQVGRDLNFIEKTQTEDGWKITILFERWIQGFELRYGTRSQDYPFTYVELFINDHGKGEGSLIGLARLTFDKKNPHTLDIENFGTYPAKLMGVELSSR